MKLKAVHESHWTVESEKKTWIYLFKNLTYDDFFIKSAGRLDAQWFKDDVMSYILPSPFM